jgi:hypothetical protein
MPKFFYSRILERELWKAATVPTNVSSDLSHNNFNLLNAELNPICHLLALLGAHHIFYVSRSRVKLYGGSNSGKYILLRQFVIFLHCCIKTAHKLFILFYNLHKTL